MKIEGTPLTPSTAPKFFVFVLMPFVESFDDTYKLAIKPACEDAGVYCERVDEQVFQGSILDRIYNQIYRADLIIADMTGRNPNVFYETGYSHALNKKVILLTKSPEEIPFDLKHHQHITYDKLTDLKRALETRIRWYVEHADGINPSLPELLTLYLNGNPFNDKQDIPVSLNHHWRRISVSFSLHNATSRTMTSSNFRLALITGQEFETLKAEGGNSLPIPQPGGGFMYLLPKLDDMLPSSWLAIEFYLLVPESEHNLVVLPESEPNLTAGAAWPAVLRVFTEAGSRDYDTRLVVSEIID